MLVAGATALLDDGAVDAFERALASRLRGAGRRRIG
jgi:hypothetical protein